ncbi:hypothetical protein DFS34DRAFT_645821 [Phlyctochytrium arcticum]|nr:hypothetical protein DFS34DRAFT_645821 [Phlyctochytrium arcticum]
MSDTPQSVIDRINDEIRTLCSPWEQPSVGPRLIPQSNYDWDEPWTNLRRVESHKFPLENTTVAEDFFQQLLQLMLHEGRDTSTFQRHHRFDNDYSIGIQHPPQRESKKCIQSPGLQKSQPTKSSQTAVLDHREKKRISFAPRSSTHAMATCHGTASAATVKQNGPNSSSYHFLANSIPASSILPRYHRIMRLHGTKSRSEPIHATSPSQRPAQSAHQVKGGDPAGINAIIKEALEEVLLKAKPRRGWEANDVRSI